MLRPSAPRPPSAPSTTGCSRTSSARCGAPHSLGQCLKSHPECRHSRRLAQFAAIEASRGITAAEIGVELARYDQGFRDERTTFKVDDRQCRGKGAVTLVEFSDFECPHCAILRPALEKFADDNASRVKLCWMSFPLSQHPNSMPAAQAALLARDKAKLWPVHDALFENQRRLSPRSSRRSSPRPAFPGPTGARPWPTRPIASRPKPSAPQVAAGVNATPTVFVNGRKLDLVPTPEILAITVDDELDWQKTRGTWTTANR
jgi:protein-disulfide isomerase